MTRAAVDTVLSGRYRLDAPLGAGATASVWRAQDLTLERAVAVKVLFDDGVDPELAARFTREGRILGRLDHPNIVRVLDTGEDGGTPFLVMELVEGRSLKERIADGPMPPREAVSLVADVAAGLATAHRAGIVHRDVKPGNILWRDGGEPKLVDFGIARASDLTTMTNANVVMGTAAYLSPEHARGEVPGPASDVYALGCVLFELLRGAPPFDGPNAVGIAYRHVHEEPPSPMVDASLDAIVLRSLAKDQDVRYPDAGVFEQALRTWQPAPYEATVVMPVAAEATTVAASPVAAASGRMALPPRAWMAAAVAGLLLVLGLAAAASNRGSASTPTTTVAPTTTTVVTTTTTTVAAAATPPPTHAPPAPRKKPGKRED